MSGELHAPATLPQGKQLPVPIRIVDWMAPGPVWTRRRGGET